MNNKLTPYIKYYDNGNVRIKGQKNSSGQPEGIEEFFYENGNIEGRTTYKGGKEDGIEEWFDEQGNITETYLWKNGEVIEETQSKSENAELDNKDEKLHISDVRQRLINHIETRINYLSGGEEMKSLGEISTDGGIVKELESLKKIIIDDNF
jgi:hypothetical protein